jgi:CubicO group peptidase (beta-lactamase class C family)
VPASAAPRTWRDSTSKFSVTAELVEVKDDHVVLKKADGKTVTVPIARLSASDRRYLASRARRVKPGNEPAADQRIGELLKPILQKADMPAMAGALVTSDGLVAFGATGVRKRGADTAVTAVDLWHLGSDTKAMTATLIAKLVEQRKLAWDTTVAQVFPELQDKFHADLKVVTVQQLLSHRSGLPANLSLTEYLGDDVVQLRRRAVERELAKPPQSAPGSKFEYSNLGYIVTGAMVEKLTGKSWEENMEEHVFGPLKMTSVGFGGTGTRGKVDQPWGHLATGGPVPGNGPAVDNPPVMGPAGRVHCTIQDWSKFVADLLRGMSGKPALLPGDSYKTLTTPPFDGEYALGWGVTQRDWAGGLALQHSGSNTMNYATVWVAPGRDFAILVCTNQGGDGAAMACDAAVGALIQHYATVGRQ